jgi:hypothetical protein
MSNDLIAALNAAASRDTVDNTIPFRERLVGEGKKFKDDEELAKGKWESDNHIKNLEKELDGMRKELETRLTMEKFMTELEKKNAIKPLGDNPPLSDEESNENVPKTTSGLKQEDVERIISDKMTEAQKQASKKRNVDYVASELKKTWGNDFQNKLLSKAEELSVGTEFLTDLASNHPQAFLRLVGADGSNRTTNDVHTFTPPKTSVTGTFGVNSNVKNFAYYEKIRKENPGKYWTIAVQKEMHEASKHVDKFYQ